MRRHIRYAEMWSASSGARTIADAHAFCEFMRRCEQAPEIVDVAIPEVSLTSFDQLLSAVGGVQ